MRSTVSAVLLALSSAGAAFLGSADAHAGQPPRIDITAHQSGLWEVSYRLHAPTQQLVFARAPDKSRGATWTAHEEFEIVATEQGEVARRRDGRRFTEASFHLAPVYMALPKDYAPFSPFGDGSTLFHTGRFFACADVCDDDAEWLISLTAEKGRHVLVNGKRKKGHAAWADSGSGRNVYVGETPPIETKDLVAVLDQSLPASIRLPLTSQLPRYMNYFAVQLGELPSRPTLFASYDTNHTEGWGRQGGTLAGQIFMHFYGGKWAEEMVKPEFEKDLAWHFAHEAAHLYQRQIVSPRPEDYWINEGGAEAFASLAVRASVPAKAFVDSRIEAARTNCMKSLKDKTIQEAIRGGNFDAAYTCGLILNLAIDAALRREAPDTDGLYAVWRDYMARARERSEAGEAEFIASLASVGGDELAGSVSRAVRTRNLDLGATGRLDFLSARQGAMDQSE